MTKLRVVTYNIHKGVQGFGPMRRLEIHNLSHAMAGMEADVLCLQEVRKMHHGESRHFPHWPEAPQAEFLAPEGYHAVYRTNAVTRHGEHGNALLSRWPVLTHQHEDMSDHRLEQRGLLHVELDVAGRSVHVLVVHLGLIRTSRARQLQQLARYVEREIPRHCPLLVAGDFNDLGPWVAKQLAGSELQAPVARRCATFPSRLPLVQLDHVLGRGLLPAVSHVPRGPQWARMSDHLPLVTEWNLPPGVAGMLKPPEVKAGHVLHLLCGGDEFFPALVGAIDAAQHEVRLETYIFDFNGQGADVAEALARAAERGVAVFVVMDGVGTPYLPAHWLERWRQSGVQWHRYAPFGYLGVMIPGRWRRLHRKLCVVDGQRAFCGGINILDDRLDPHFGALSVPRLDYAVAVTGPLVAQCHAVMAQFWARLQATRQLESLQWTRVRQSWKAFRLLPPLSDAPGASKGDDGSVLAALLLRDNVRNRTTIERSYLKAIGSAREHVVLANAYFLPGGRLRRALIHAVKRGVRVRVVVQGQYEYFMQYHAARPVLSLLAARGVEICEYMPGFLHAKVAVVDGVWATIGSSNLDPLSLLLAREANVVVHDEKFAGRLSGALEQVIQGHTRPWDLTADAHRPWFERVFDRMAYGAMRLILLFSGRRY